MVIQGVQSGAKAAYHYINGRTSYPVHIPTGAKILDGDEDHDFSVAGRLPFDWIRSYNSLNKRAGMHVRGWTCLYDLQLILNDPLQKEPRAHHTFLDLQGRLLPVPELACGEKWIVGQEGLTFARTIGGHWMVQFSDGLVIDFGHVEDSTPVSGSRTLKPQVIEDRNGNAHYLHYDAQGRLVTILTSCGQRFALVYDETHPERLAMIGRQTGGADSPITP